MVTEQLPIWWRLGSDDLPNPYTCDDYADMCATNTLSDERPHVEGVDDAEWHGRIAICQR